MVAEAGRRALEGRRVGMVFDVGHDFFCDRRLSGRLVLSSDGFGHVHGHGEEESFQDGLALIRALDVFQHHQVEDGPDRGIGSRREANDAIGILVDGGL